MATVDQSRLGVVSSTTWLLVGATNVGAAKCEAHACCGEIVNPHSSAEEIVDPIRISKKKNEAIVFFPLGIPVLFGLFNYFPQFG